MSESLLSKFVSYLADNTFKATHDYTSSRFGQGSQMCLGNQIYLYYFEGNNASGGLQGWCPEVTPPYNPPKNLERNEKGVVGLSKTTARWKDDMGCMLLGVFLPSYGQGR